MLITSWTGRHGKTIIINFLVSHSMWEMKSVVYCSRLWKLHPPGHRKSKSPRLFLRISDSGLGVLRHFQRPKSFIMDIVCHPLSWDFTRTDIGAQGEALAAERIPLYANNNTVQSNSCPQSTAPHPWHPASIIFLSLSCLSCPVEIRDFHILLYAEMIELIPNSYKYNTLIHPCIP